MLAHEAAGEPDSESTCRIVELMRNLNQELCQTFAIVTHDPIVAGFTSRQIRLRGARIVAEQAREPKPFECTPP